VARVTRPPEFLALNAISSKTVKATNFKFDKHVSRDSPDMTREKLLFCKNSLGGDMHSYERLLVYLSYFFCCLFAFTIVMVNKDFHKVRYLLKSNHQWLK